MNGGGGKIGRMFGRYGPAGEAECGYVGGVAARTGDPGRDVATDSDERLGSRGSARKKFGEYDVDDSTCVIPVPDWMQVSVSRGLITIIV